MPVLTTGQVWGDTGWGREEMKMRANRGCPVILEGPRVWGVQNLQLPRNQTPTFPEDILLKFRIVIQPSHFSFSKKLPNANMDF